MGHYLIEQVFALLEPLGFVWLWLLVTMLLFARRRRWRSAFAVAVPVVVLFVFGSTELPGWLLRGLEEPYAGVDLAKLPKADAIVLLGGGTEPARFEVGDMHLTPAGDRVLMALELSRLGKAPVLVVGGNTADFPEGVRLESETLRDWLVSRHLTEGEVIPLSPCTSTHDEALGVAKLARDRNWHEVLLVTSANHMRRAAATFRTAGVHVIPAPCNFMTEISHAPTLDLGPSIPRAGILGKMGPWLHEKIGWWEYRRRGWIDPSKAEG